MKEIERRDILSYASYINKPCKKIKNCPYGILVETFPLQNPSDKYSCTIFGHDCPCFYLTEMITE